MVTFARRIRAGMLVLVLSGVAALATGPQGMASPASADPTGSVGSLASYDGKRIKEAGDPKVWLVLCGQRANIPNEATYNGLFRDWSGIVLMSDVDSIREGAGLQGAFLAKGASAHVYLVRPEGGRKHYIASEAAFNRWNFDWSEITTISQSYLDRLSNGCILG
ncbi:hypothetical protein KIPE111705_42460 [Kibdelosporangium persicum]|uniref:Uncharacterized protein n=1 Tax=Kibdelosporangium persicum TaxID=2698649 RepID=A0ABX2FJ73_9PSEU|nr:hypothetical protein [Kibdelosporangium persicum]NRN70922.1 hypothetical protein [Kibdelosporangium persicum]